MVRACAKSKATARRSIQAPAVEPEEQPDMQQEEFEEEQQADRA